MGRIKGWERDNIFGEASWTNKNKIRFYRGITILKNPVRKDYAVRIDSDSGVSYLISTKVMSNKWQSKTKEEAFILARKFMRENKK